MLLRSIIRSIHFAPHCDLLWMETKNPVFKQAQRYAREVRAGLGGAAGQRKMFAYNLSPRCVAALGSAERWLMSRAFARAPASTGTRRV